MEMAMATGNTSVKVNSGGSGGILTECSRDLLQTEETRGSWGLPLTPSGEIGMSKPAWARCERKGFHLGLERDTQQASVSSGDQFGRHEGPCRLTQRSKLINFPNLRGPQDHHRKPNVMPGCYDGTTPLPEYLHHFYLVADVNCWTEEEAGLYLGVSLSGAARRILMQTQATGPGGLQRLVMALERRFQPRDRVSQYKAQLKARRQQKGERLEQLGDAIERLTQLAYPTVGADITDELCRDHFMAALMQGDLRQWVHQSRPQTYGEAMASALQGEAYFRSERDRGPLRVATCVATLPADLEEDACSLRLAAAGMCEDSFFRRQEEGNTSMKYILTEILSKLTELSRRRPRSRNCFRCGSPEHFKRDCPEMVNTQSEGNGHRSSQ